MMVASCVSVGMVLTVNLNKGLVNVGVTDCNSPGPHHVVRSGYPGVELATHFSCVYFMHACTICINGINTEGQVPSIVLTC